MLRSDRSISPAVQVSFHRPENLRSCEGRSRAKGSGILSSAPASLSCVQGKLVDSARRREHSAFLSCLRASAGPGDPPGATDSSWREHGLRRVAAGSRRQVLHMLRRNDWWRSAGIWCTARQGRPSRFESPTARCVSRSTRSVPSSSGRCPRAGCSQTETFRAGQQRPHDAAARLTPAPQPRMPFHEAVSASRAPVPPP